MGAVKQAEQLCACHLPRFRMDYSKVYSKIIKINPASNKYSIKCKMKLAQ